MNYKIPLWQHQLAAIERAKDVDEFALFFEVGTGKTATAINILRHKFHERKATLNTLILCPQIVIENWRREWLTHSHINPDQVSCLRGTAKKRIKVLKEACAKGPVIAITNYEALLMNDLFSFIDKKFCPKAIVLDESHKCKSITAKRTKRAIQLGMWADYRYILSGTPITNSLFDIFSQFLFLDKGVTFGEKIYEFKYKYFVDHNANMPRHCYFPDWQPRAGAGSEISKLIFTKAMRVTKAECLDLPPLVKQVVEVELSAEQRKLYNEMHKESVSIFKDQVISADLAIKRALRLQQIVTGHIVDDNGVTHKVQHNRINALREILESIGHEHKVIIWAVFKNNYEDIRALLKEMEIGYGEIHGEVSAKKQQEAVEQFNSPLDNIRAVICHPASGGVGVNLTRGSYSVFYSRSFSLEHDLQAEARNYRGGSEIHERVTRIDIVAPNTIDEVVQLALAAKLDISNTILTYWRNHERRDSDN